MTILPSGNVGIGTTSPTAIVAINGSATPGLEIDLNGSTKGVFAVASFAGDVSTDAATGDVVVKSANTKLLFNTNNGASASSMAINGGNVGIGTTSPAEQLQVVSSSSGGGIGVISSSTNSYNGTLAFNDANSGASAGVVQVGAAGPWFTNAAVNDLVIRSSANRVLLGANNGGSASVVAIVQGGNVGIGTTSPIGTLDVENGSGTAAICLNGSCSAQSLTSNGYQKLPGGLIIQWGTGTASVGGPVSVTFPIVFPMLFSLSQQRTSPGRVPRPTLPSALFQLLGSRSQLLTTDTIMQMPSIGSHMATELA